MQVLRKSSALTSRLSSSSARWCMRPATTQLHHPPRPGLSQQQRQQRTFLGNPFAPSVQSLTASRTLPYPSAELYDIIADVSSYQAFLPFCQKSDVTKLSQPDERGKRWPEEGRLVVGFNDDISETFYSRIYCVPGQIVEAVSGATETSILSPHKIAHHNARPPASEDPSRNATVLTHLLTRWSLRPSAVNPGTISFETAPQGSSSSSSSSSSTSSSSSPSDKPTQYTEVHLAIDYCFANPLYGALSSAAAPKVADKMIQAFETRVKAVLAKA